MGQVTATTERYLKETSRDRAAIFWIIAFPIIWVIINSFTFTRGMPEEGLPLLRGSYAIHMAILAVMIAAIVGFPASIASDRERGLLSKLLSMPILPWKDAVGRLLGIFGVSAVAVALVFAVGSICGGRFHPTHLGILKSIGFFLLALLAAVGIGSIIGTFIKRQYGALMTGVGVVIGTASISGIFLPYPFLPSPLQAFSKIYPLSSCNSAVIALLAGGEESAGYNPLTAGHIVLTTTISIALFVIGLLLYRRFCWGRRWKKPVKMLPPMAGKQPPKTRDRCPNMGNLIN